MGGVHDPRWDHIDGDFAVNQDMLAALPVAVQVLSAGTWQKEEPQTISLVFDQRYRRRLRMMTDAGMAFLLNLPTAHALHHGDGLVLEDGRIVQVCAAPEPLMCIYASDFRHLARLAWHIGNRHLPAMIEADKIVLRPDTVIQDMLIGLDARIEHVTGPFQPEPGAYAAHPRQGDIKSHAHG